MYDSQMLRHFLASLAYRFQKAIREAPQGFDTFEAGHGIRTPIAIIGHMNGVLGFARNILESGDSSHNHVAEQSWEAQIKLFHETLQDIDELLTKESYQTDLLKRLLQGPLADAMTHIGQLATLRRMAGSPIRGENFFAAEIKKGHLSEEQPKPADPDEP